MTSNNIAKLNILIQTLEWAAVSFHKAASLSDEEHEALGLLLESRKDLRDYITSLVNNARGEQ